MPFEELIKLKQKLGTKVYNATVLGTPNSPSKPVRKDSQAFKRDNKNRPREMTSKRPVPITLPRAKKETVLARDPRFDPKCGDFDRDEFKDRFSFVNELKLQEVSQLREEMLTCKDADDRAKLKLLAQRLENQAREEQHRKDANKKTMQERKQMQDNRSEGKPVVFESKKKRKIENLVQKFRELKETGKLQKHIEKRRKKKAAQDRKKLKVLD